MKLRNILTLLGALCLALGPVLMHHVDSTTVYLIGEICLAIGPVLMGARAFMSDGSAPVQAPALTAESPLGTPAQNGMKGSNATNGSSLWSVLWWLAVAGLIGLALTGCGSAPQQLPPLPKGSYAEGDAGYSKDTGPTAGITVHIPLDGGYSK